MLWKISFYYGSCLCDIMPPKQKKKSLYNFKDYDSLELL